MKSLKECIRRQVSINNLALDNIIQHFEKRDLRKGAFLLQAGYLCREMAFIESGYLRMFAQTEGREITFWIGGKGKFITSLSSFVFASPNFWNIQAVTHCTLQVINRHDHFKLLKKEPLWLEFDNNLLAHSFALLEKSMFAHLHTTAMQRLQNLLREDPEMFHHVPLQYIASMLGITPESLSRLRSQLAHSIS